MKRLFLISFMLLLLGAVYADGPRYRFKSRRALQSLWRKEKLENPQSFGFDSQNRKLTPREMNGENQNGLEKKKHVYGVVTDNPFDKNSLQYGSETSRQSSSSRLGGTLDGIVIPPYKQTDDGPHIVIGRKDPEEPVNPFVKGRTTGGTGQGYGSPPIAPVGDGLGVMMILAAALIVIKKRLS